MPKIVITFGMTIGMLLTPIYSLSMFPQMFYGEKLFNGPNSYFCDSGPRASVKNCIHQNSLHIKHKSKFHNNRTDRSMATRSFTKRILGYKSKETVFSALSDIIRCVDLY